MPSDEPTVPPPSHPPPPPPTGDGAAPDGVPPEVARWLEPRRLHPASIVLGVDIRQMIQAFLFPAVATLAAGGAFTVVVLTIVAVVGLVVRLLAWQRMTFSLDGEVLRVDSGVLSRSHRSLDVARIQQVEVQRGVITRLLSLAALKVETAGSASEVEVDLRVLTESDAVALRSAVRASKARLERDAGTTDHRQSGAPSEPILTVPMRHIALASVTGARLLVFPAVIGGAFQFVGQQMAQFGDWVARRMIQIGSPTELVGPPRWTTVALVAAGALVLSVLTAIAVGLVRDGRYRITRVGDDLHISRGLLATNDSVLPLRRVQLVEIQRNWLRRLLGFATVRIRSAGGSAEGAGRVGVPLLHAQDVDELISHVLPGVDGVPDLRRHPPEALRRALFRWLRPTAFVIVVVWVAAEYLPFFDLPFEDVLRWAVLATIPAAAVLAVVEYRQLAHGLTERVVASRRGALSITTSLAPVVKVQAVSSRRSLFQRRLGLTTLDAHVAGPGAELQVLDAGVEDARGLHARLTEHAASPTPVEVTPT